MQARLSNLPPADRVGVKAMELADFGVDEGCVIAY